MFWGDKVEVLLEKSAESIVNWMNTINKVDAAEEDKLKYGIEIVLYNFLSTMCVLCIGTIFSDIKNTLITYLAFGIFRIAAGGMHFDTSIQCLTVTSLIVAGSANVAETFEISKTLMLVMYGIMIVGVYKYAPSGTLIHPIREEDRKSRKIQSIFLLFIYMIISLLSNNLIGKLIFVAACCEVITILPFANKKYQS